MIDSSHNLHILLESAERGNNHSKRNTVLCRHYKRGHCMLGNKCAFLHEKNHITEEDVKRLCSDKYTWGDESA